MSGPLPVQVTRLPAAGYAGSQDPQLTTYGYDGASHLIDVVTDPDGAKVRVHYERDGYERVTAVENSVDATHTQRTTYAYDAGMPVPKSVTAPGGSNTTYANYDPNGRRAPGGDGGRRRRSADPDLLRVQRRRSRRRGPASRTLPPVISSTRSTVG